MGETFRYMRPEHERCDRSSICCLASGHAPPCVCDACAFPMLEHTDEELAECVEILEEVERDMGAVVDDEDRADLERAHADEELDELRADAWEAALLRRLDQRREDDGPQMRLW